MFSKIKLFLGLVGGALAALWLYLTAHKQGRAKGQREVAKEHQKIVAKIEAKEAAKHAVTPESVQNRLNDRFGGKP